MRSTASQPPPFRFSIVIVTTDERVQPEAEAYLAEDYELRVLSTWDALISLV